MRFLILSVIASLFLSFASASIAEASTKWIKAGADSSGGGKSVVCRDGAGKILSVEMLDLYEARAMYGLEPLEMGSEMRAILGQAKQRLAESMYWGEAIGKEIDRVEGSLRILPPGTRLEPVDDASPIVLPEGCLLEQAAVWIDQSLVMADRELWQAMDARNRAALIVHETVYDHTRRWSFEKNSRRARKIVGHVFGAFELGRIGESVPLPVKICQTVTSNRRFRTSFWVYQGADGRTVAQFHMLRGRSLVGLNRAYYTMIRFDPGQPDSIAEAATVESSFEAPTAFMLLWDAQKEPENRLLAVDHDENGAQVTLKMSCYQINRKD